MSEFIAPLLYISISQTFFVAFVAITKKKPVLSDRFLSIWLLFLAFSGLYNLLNFKHSEILHARPVIDLILAMANPIMLYYVRSLSIPDYKINRNELYYLIPYLFLFFTIFGISGERFFIPRNLSGINSLSTSNTGIVLSTALVFIIFYAWHTFKVVNDNLKEMSNTYSVQSEEVKLRWVKCVVVLMFISQIMTFLSMLYVRVNNMSVEHGLDTRIFILTLSNVILVYTLTYFGLKQPSLFAYHHHALQDGNIQNIQKKSEVKQDANKLLDNEQAKKYVEALSFFMKKDKPYLRPNLSAIELAEFLGISRHQLTELLNEHLNNNFYTYVNAFRLEEVKRKLSDKTYNHLTVLAIAYDSGFNSKSAFNMIFKQSTGITPSVFRKKAIESE